MTHLPSKPTGKTATGLSKETDAFLAKLMKQNGMSQRKQKEMIEQIQMQGALPKPEKPKPYKYNMKPKPERKVYTMARVGQRPLMKQEEQIIEDTNFYEPEQAPSVPLGPSNEERKNQLVTKMWGIDEEAERKKAEEARAAMADLPEFTVEDQIIEEIRGRTEFLEEMHELGVHDHDGETLRQIDQRMDELKMRRKKKESESS
ncbi:hypothetical protein TRFO_27148 [Tritrichomonas foetus]|uniref:Uncharacterized protein n=1 Tax=Tritrichomonas foetus TaxID=1144522 RepID=A0A1J4K313_9EUKA|nr:hypothetical protein TRFO_27148 [Tritrichomonas foetus]|eukprot:OHT05208.1 hypothetical protein TRFO_27148 [Tritrichomonas foetus]